MPTGRIRHTTAYSWTEKVLCEACNNEFSGRLDEEVKSTLSQMVADQVVLLDASAQRTLSLWSLKVAFVIANAWLVDGLPAVFSDLAYGFWLTGEPPPDVIRVYTNGAAASSRSAVELGLPPSHRHANRVLIRESTHHVESWSRRDGRVHSLVVSFVIGSAAFRVVLDASPPASPPRRLQELLRICPTNREMVWPIRHLVVDFSRPER